MHWISVEKPRRKIENCRQESEIESVEMVKWG